MSECMTQEDAERMDAKQAIQILKPLMDMMRDQYGCPISDAYFAIGKAINALDEQDKIVRCKDCKWYGADLKVCCCPKSQIENDVEPDWFCADGVRKEKENDK